MTLNIFGEKDGFRLELEGYQEFTDSNRFVLHAPRWSYRFETSDGGSDIARYADQALDSLVEEILRNPAIAREVARRVSEAEHMGCYGAYDEQRTGRPYRMGGV